jgi:RNA recognition motif-containing protein
MPGYADFSVGTQCIVMRNRDTGRARGFGFVTLSSSGEADDAELERV